VKNKTSAEESWPEGEAGLNVLFAAEICEEQDENRDELQKRTKGPGPKIGGNG